MFHPDRRTFLRRSAALSIMGAAAPWAMNLAALADASAATVDSSSDSTDYKALVCVFLVGGNDHANTLVPYDLDSHQAYAAARTNLATARADLAATVLSTRGLPEGRQMALAPSLALLKPLFEAQRLGVLLNIGPLVKPITVADFRQGRNLPPRLFSHNDQQAVWQSYAPEGGTTGWGGLIGDVWGPGPSAGAFTCVNTSGQAVFLSGNVVQPYALVPGGPLPLHAVKDGLFGDGSGSSTLRSAVLEELIGQNLHPLPLAREHAKVMVRALAAQSALSDALAGTPDFGDLFIESENVVKGGVSQLVSRPLARQLRTVARMIAAGPSQGLRRQVFFVSLGGFDLHDGLLAQHAGLLQQVAQALSGFDQAVQQMGMDRQVTTFTASDFGRTLSSNGDGSDHGWGGHHLVMGGAVAGGQFFGQLPPPGLEGDEHHVGQGRLLPTMAVDQLAASLARWMGVGESDLGAIAPHHGEFDASVLAGLFRSEP